MLKLEYVMLQLSAQALARAHSLRCLTPRHLRMHMMPLNSDSEHALAQGSS